MLSHLPATDLLTVKLVSRRFHDLVNSPHVWISAFSQHFPGASTLDTSRATSDEDQIFTTERRSFTRLSPVASWTSEYLVRTKLLRCLARGRPSLPFAAPSQGKPHKGFATFSFYSHLRVITSLDAKFGPVHDKRLPQFIHGCGSLGTVSISDRRGELSGWGLTENLSPFTTFEERHPGTAMWGAGRGEVVGVPNVMEVSHAHGMVMGEGYPGGNAFLLGSNMTHPRLLTPLLDTHHEFGLPRVFQSSNAFCSAWIAKSQSVPRQTQGLVGMLFGSSSGVVTAYSLGTLGGREQKLERGELTARWLLSPGVPIVAIQVDENGSNARMEQRRVWAVALNALGEVFYLQDLPKRPARVIDHAVAPEVAQELRSWNTGHSAPWVLAKPTMRAHRPSYIEDQEPPSYYHHAVWSGYYESSDLSSEMRSVESWLSKTPADIKARFNGWDMRQRLEVDFSGDDGHGSGESVFVFRCGHDEVADESDRNVKVWRYTRCVRPEIPLAANVASEKEESKDARIRFDWHSSQLVFGRAKHSNITTTAIDSSIYAWTTFDEDLALWRARLTQMEASSKVQSSGATDPTSAPRIPGQRARFVAAGTSTGQIYLWDARATVSVSPSIANDVQPSRVIYTNSAEISSLALTALYVVHGGSEGLVQAWDPLCSTTHPIRTICSALSRRAILAAQQDPSRKSGAVGAICLDPDPCLLRGIVALRGNLRYWSYSSSSINKELSKSQKRRLHRAARGIRSGTSDGFTGGRRVDLKDFVSQEMVERRMEEQEKRAQEKQNKRINGRFGLDLLGSDASEEELMAYATLLSEEEQKKQVQKSMEKTLNRNASEAEVKAHLIGLSTEDYERWKFASWEDRFHMPASEPNTITRTTPASTPTRGQAAIDDDLAKAMRLSLQDNQGPSSASRAPEPSRQQSSEDDHIAEAIRRSLGQSSPSPVQSPSRSHDADADADADVAEAIRLSLQDQSASPSSSLSPSGSRSQSLSVADDDDFPALGSSPMSTPPPGAWGKGKRRL